jgi:hypothetical protein
MHDYLNSFRLRGSPFIVIFYDMDWIGLDCWLCFNSFFYYEFCIVFVICVCWYSYNNNKRPLEEVEISDFSLKDYIPVKDKASVFLPHTAGRYQKKRFRKAQCPLVERLVNSLMFHGRNTGKKM